MPTILSTLIKVAVSPFSSEKVLSGFDVTKKILSVFLKVILPPLALILMSSLALIDDIIVVISSFELFTKTSLCP